MGLLKITCFICGLTTPGPTRVGPGKICLVPGKKNPRASLVPSVPQGLRSQDETNHVQLILIVRFVSTLLVYDNTNNGDKFYLRKSMRAADEKLIINELGHCYTSSGHGITSQVYQGRGGTGGQCVQAANSRINLYSPNFSDFCQSCEALTLSKSKWYCW